MIINILIIKSDTNHLQTSSAPSEYKYDWHVQDAYTANEFGQEEARSGYNIDGGYTVLLPDGRKQIVTYNVADAYSGYVADVRYEGEGIKNENFKFHNDYNNL